MKWFFFATLARPLADNRLQSTYRHYRVFLKVPHNRTRTHTQPGRLWKHARQWQYVRYCYRVTLCSHFQTGSVRRSRGIAHQKYEIWYFNSIKEVINFVSLLFRHNWIFTSLLIEISQRVRPFFVVAGARDLANSMRLMWILLDFFHFGGRFCIILLRISQIFSNEFWY